jgi:hypothetical protein
MAISEFETKRLERLVSRFIAKRRPPPHIRDELDLGYRFSGQSVEIFEIRPWWRDKRRKIEESVAKATYVKRRRIWKVFWQRADLKWHRYEAVSEVDSVEEFLALADADEYCCFFG